MATQSMIFMSCGPLGALAIRALGIANAILLSGVLLLLVAAAVLVRATAVRTPRSSDDDRRLFGRPGL